MHRNESITNEIMVLCLESLDNVEYKDFIVTQLDELTEEDFNDVIGSSNNTIDYGEDSLHELTGKILKWHADRLITVNGNSLTQTVKLQEEMGELAAGIVRNRKTDIKDALGDMYVVMVAIAQLEGFTIEECINHAYNEIEGRKGYLNEHGNFIKDQSN